MLIIHTDKCNSHLSSLQSETKEFHFVANKRDHYRCSELVKVQSKCNHRGSDLYWCIYSPASTFKSQGTLRKRRVEDCSSQRKGEPAGRLCLWYMTGELHLANLKKCGHPKQDLQPDSTNWHVNTVVENLTGTQSYMKNDDKRTSFLQT